MVSPFPDVHAGGELEPNHQPPPMEGKGGPDSKSFETEPVLVSFDATLDASVLVSPTPVCYSRDHFDCSRRSAGGWFPIPGRLEPDCSAIFAGTLILHKRQTGVWVKDFTLCYYCNHPNKQSNTLESI